MLIASSIKDIDVPLTAHLKVSLAITSEPKINRDLVLIETNQHVKYEGSAIDGSQDIEWKPILHKRTL